MGSATITLPETQIVEWVSSLSPQAKHEVLRRLIVHLDDLEARIERGEEHMRNITVRRGAKDWAAMTDDEQAALIDDILHE